MSQDSDICHCCKEPMFWDTQCENVMRDRCGKPTCVKCEYDDRPYTQEVGPPRQICIECYGRMEE